MAEEARTVYARIPYVSDKEVHVSVVESPHDGAFFESREYIPSLDLYGRGLTFPMSLLGQYLEGVEAVAREAHMYEKDAEDA